MTDENPPPWGTPPQGPPPYQPPPAQPPAFQPPGYPAYPAPPAYGQPFAPAPPPQKPRRTRLVLAIVAAVVLVAAAVVVPLVLLGDDDEPGGDTGTEAGTPSPTETTEAPDLSAVETFETLPTTHVTEPVTYEQSPPVGGPHFGEWLECGVYDAPVRDENAVHDLEHGAVWITYEPGLDEDDVATLAAALPQNGIMSPYDGLSAPVVVTVWEHQLALDGADDPRLELFIEEYDDGVTAPEPFASCAGGTAEGPRGA